MPSRTDAPKRRLVLLGALFSVLVWAANYPAMKVAFRDLAPLAYTGWRFIGAALLWAVLAKADGSPLVPPKGSRGLALLLAMSGVGVYQWFWALGVAGTTGFSAALLNSTSPLIAFLLVAALGWERLTPLVSIGTVLAYVGLALFIAASKGTHGGSLRGDALCLGAAFCWAVFSVAASRIRGRMRPFTAQAVTFTWGTPVVLAYCWPAMRAQDYGRVSPLAWTILVLSIVLPLVISFELWTQAIRTLGITATTSLGFLIPVLAGVGSAVWTGERFSAPRLGAAVVVLVGLAMTRMRWRRQPAPEPEALASPPEA